MSDRLTAESGTLEIPDWLQREMSLSEEDKLRRLLNAAGLVWDAWHVRAISLPDATERLRCAMLTLGYDVAHYEHPSPYLDALDLQRLMEGFHRRREEHDEWYVAAIRRDEELEERRSRRVKGRDCIFSAIFALDQLWERLCRLQRKWKPIERMDVIVAESLAAILCGILLLAGRRPDGNNS